MDARFERFANGLTPDFLAGTIAYVNNEGRQFDDDVGLLLVHFFNHQTHHRGQAHALVTAAGEDTGGTDLLGMVPPIS
jgi:uncharacterized damage-inducible protein DinB